MIQIVGPPLHQWDTGRSISVSGSNATHVHMANRGDSHAVIMEITDGETKIPNYLLQSGKDLCVYLVLDKVTQESKTFPVRKRERPQDYVYSEDKRNYIYELITEAEEATEAARKVEQELREAWANGEFDGPPGDGKVKTVNGNGPDENGNVQVSSTCDLEQPRWGRTVKEEEHELVRAEGDERNGYVTPMSAEEFSELMANAHRAEISGSQGGDGPVNLSDIRHEDYDYVAGEEHIPCMIYYGQAIGTLTLYGKRNVTDQVVKIPDEYTDFAVKTVNGISPDEDGNIEIPVGGGTPEGAVLYTEQVLTPEQQAQARENIGAFGSKQSADNAGTLLYVGSDGNVTNVVVGDGLDVVYGHGKNIVREDWASGYWSPTGWNESTGVGNCGLREKVPVVPGGTYTASFVKFGNIAENYIFIYIYEYDQDGNYLVENTQVKGLYFRPTSPKTFTVGANTAYIGVRLYLSGVPTENIIPEGFMIEAGSVATEYEPYTEGYTVTAQKQTAESITDLAYAEHAPSMTVRSIAHRGVTKNAPDCTAPAYILARKAGFTVAENDVQITSDGKYVMWHDTTLAKCTIVYSLDGKQLYSDANGNRYWVSASNVYAYDETTGEYTLTDVAVSTLTRIAGSSLTVADQTYGFLRNIDVGGWKSGKFTSTQMLSFEEWIDLCKMLGMECYIDSKFQYTVDQAAELVAIARKKGMLRKCSWLASSLGEGTPLYNIRLADPKARCGILYAPTENKFVENGAFDKALKAGGEGSVFWNPQNTNVTAENVEMTLALGYGYECWYVGTASLSEEVYFAEIERLLKCGCQGLTLDDRTVEHFTNYKYGNAMKN